MFSYNLIYMKFSWIHNIIRHNTTRYSSRHSVKCDKNQNYGDKNCILSAFCNTRSSHCVNWTSCKKLNIFKWGGRVNNPDNFYIGFLIIKKAIKTFFTVILSWREGRIGGFKQKMKICNFDTIVCYQTWPVSMTCTLTCCG